MGNVWTAVCLGAVVSCSWLGIYIYEAAGALDVVRLPVRLLVSFAAVFGALAGLRGVVLIVVEAARERHTRDSTEEAAVLRARNRMLETRSGRQSARLDELTALREIATVVNQESDFAIIAEKALELVNGLLEPLDATVFLEDPRKARMVPFAQYADGKSRTGRRVTTRSIPDFDIEAFESHSVICRVRGQELHVIAPLRVEEAIHGVLFLAFATDGRPAQEQTAQFNDEHRVLLLEITHHLCLAVKTKYLHTKALIDALTQLYSRSHFDTQMQSAVELCRRTGGPFSLILVDIDHFKKVNDTYGHDTGDIVLERVERRILGILRKYDTAYRYGGEELAILLPGTPLPEAIRIAERLRGEIAARKFRGADNRLIPITASLGVAECTPADEAEAVFRRADQRLYAAKHEGRNRVMPAPA